MKTPVYQIHTDQEQLTAIFDKTGDISRNFLNRIGELATTSHAPQPELLQLQPEGKGALAALEEFQLRFGDSLVAGALLPAALPPLLSWATGWQGFTTRIPRP